MATVFAQITISLELDELSANGTQLDLLGLSSATKQYLERLPISGPELRVLSVEPTTKLWEIETQLAANKPFVEPDPMNIPDCEQ